MSELTPKDFARILMYGSVEERASRNFLVAGKLLVDRFNGDGASVKGSDRVDFRNYIDFLRLSHGLDHAMFRLEELRVGGLTAELYGTAGMITARRANDYVLAAEHLGKSHEIWPHNETIQEFLIESLISCARFAAAGAVFAQVKPVAERQAVRFANLAAVIGRWDLVENLVGPWAGADASFEIRVLGERVRHSAGFNGQQRDITAYVLNMPSDTRKLDLVSLHLNNLGVTMERQAGVNAGSLTAAEWAESAGHKRLNLGVGAMGCALGHISMWRRFQASSEDYGLMMEDDAYPFVHRDIGTIIDAAEDFDVLFVHSGMSALKSGSLESGYMSIWNTLERRTEGGGWGAYGYILSRSGVEKLLDAVRVDKVAGHIDGQLASYGVDTSAEIVSNAQRIGRSIHSKTTSKAVLDVKCARFPLIGTIDFGDSSIGRMGGHFR